MGSIVGHVSEARVTVGDRLETLSHSEN